MNHITHTLCIAALWAMGCGQLERSNPYDTHGQQAEQPTAAIALQIPMAKALAIVVYRVEAILAGPGSPTITKQLDISPLGPATGIIGTSAPGEGFSLSCAATTPRERCYLKEARRISLLWRAIPCW